MPLSQLIYYSQARDLTLDSLQAILERSYERNQATGVTGMLVRDQQGFLQCLEGEREQVTATFARIVADPRHDRVTLIAVHDIDERDFPDWTMSCVLSRLPETTAILRELGLGEQFRAQDIPASTVIAFIRRVRDQHRTA